MNSIAKITRLTNWKDNTSNKPVLNMSIDDAVQAIETSNDEYSYFSVIDEDTEYNVFLDADSWTEDVSIFEAREAIAAYFLVSEDKVYFTENESGHKYHFSIPKLFGTIEVIKQWVEEFNLHYPQFELDTAIYKKGTWRLPNQLKPTDKEGLQPNTRHIVQEGEIKYFIPEYIENDAIELEPKGLLKKDKVHQNHNTEVMDTGDKVKEVETILKHLKPDRCDHYADWIRIGMIIKNEKLPFSLWNEWSKTSSKYDALKIEEVWDGFKDNGGLTIDTLWYYLMNDNHSQWKDLKSSKVAIGNVITQCSNMKCAEFFYKVKPTSYMYKAEFGWYKINKFNVWEYSTKEPASLSKDLFDTLKSFALHHDAKLSQELATLEADNPKYVSINDKKKEILKFLKTIGSYSFIKGVIELVKSFYERDVFELIDTKTNLFACDDKVFDTDTCKWREIEPNDYISTTTGYCLNCNVNKQVKKEVNEFLDTLYKTEEDVLYFKKSIARCLNGDRKGNAETFNVWTGRGGNGKSLSGDQVKNTFGKYYHTISSDTLTKAQDKKGQAQPELAQSRGKRLVMATEPEGNERLQESIIKLLTGGDQISTRDLYKSNVEFVPQFGLFLQCNDIPKIKINDAIVRRLVIQKFPFKFVTDPKDDTIEKKRDNLLPTKVKSPEWRDAFLEILVETYTNHLKHKPDIQLPENVKKATNEYIEENNPVGVWLKDNYEMTSNVNDKIKARDMYNDFIKDCNKYVSEKEFARQMDYNNVNKRKDRTGAFYTHIKRTTTKDECQINDTNDVLDV